MITYVLKHITYNIINTHFLKRGFTIFPKAIHLFLLRLMFSLFIFSFSLVANSSALNSLILQK